MPEVALQYARMPIKEDSIRKHPAQIFRFPKIRFHLKMVVNKKPKKKIIIGIIPIPKYLIPVSRISINQLLRVVLNMVSKTRTVTSINNLRRQEVTKKRSVFLIDGNLYIRFLLKDCKLLMLVSGNCNCTLVSLLIYNSTFTGNITGVLPVSL